MQSSRQKIVRILFLIGTIHWFLIFLIHPILVDIDLVLGLHSPIGPEVWPDENRTVFEDNFTG